MPPPTASPHGSPPTLLLQRRRSDGDCERWRTVLQVPLEQLLLASHWVALAEQIDDGVQWRLTSDGPAAECYSWSDGRWIDGLTMH